MPLKPLTFREVRRRLEAAGFVEMSSRGSHVKFVRYSQEGTRVAIVGGTLRSILRQAGLSAEEFEAL